MPQLSAEELNIIFNNLNQNKEDFPIFIETGTLHGDTTYSFVNDFNKLYTIEVYTPLYNKALSRFANLPKVKCILGDSVKMLPEILNIENKLNIFFWLDGHNSGDGTGFGEKGCPLLEECKEIDNNLKSNKAIIVIDDCRDFGKNVGMDSSWVNINEKTILNCFNKLKIIDIFYLDSFMSKNDRMVILIENK